MYVCEFVCVFVIEKGEKVRTLSKDMKMKLKKKKFKSIFMIANTTHVLW